MEHTFMKNSKDLVFSRRTFLTGTLATVSGPSNTMERG